MVRCAMRKQAADREAWLRAACDKLRPYIRSRTGLYVPEVNVSTGFPSRNGTRATVVSSVAIGECWPANKSADKRAHVFISPFLGDAVRVLDVLAHELLHAALPKAGHGEAFAQAARAVGLVGKPTATVAGPDFVREAVAMIRRWLGAYPHPKLAEFNPTTFTPFDPRMLPGSPMPRLGPRQTTRMRLYVCGHGQKIRAATDTLKATCGICGTVFAKQ